MKNCEQYDFVRSGYIHIRDGRLYYAGNAGYDWSSRAYPNTTYAYYLNFSTGLNPSLNSNRWLGFPLRCLSTAVD